MYKTALARQKRNKKIYKKFLMSFSKFARQTKKIEKVSIKFATIMLLLTMNVVMFNIPITNAFYNDTESATGNTFQAAMLDFRLTKSSFSGFVGKEYKGEKDVATIAVPITGSLGMQYNVFASSTSPICDQFTLNAERNEVLVYSGPISGFNLSTSTEFGTFDLEFDLPVDAPVTQEDLCQADLIFQAWRENIDTPEQSGYFDIEILSLNLKAKTIVLNEILANPNPTYPYPANREFIELKNNGNLPVDVAGWKVSEMTAGGVENKYTITTATTGSYRAIPYGGSTIIPAGGWLVLLLSGTTALNNDGDTVRLYNGDDNKLDEYSYLTTKYGFTDARYLDGVGDWVDPYPTPNMTNILEADSALISILNSILESDAFSISPDIATTTPEIIETSTSTTEIVALPPFKEEEIVATTTSEVVLDVIVEEPAVVIPPDLEITPPDPLLQSDSAPATPDKQEGESEIPSPDQGEGQGGVLEPIIESVPVIETP